MQQDVIAEARTWLDTPYHHQGRKKHVGVDCLGLIVGVAQKCGVDLLQHDVRGYSPAPDGVRLKTVMDEVLYPITQLDAGDIVLLRFARYPQHVAWVSGYGDGQLGLIHCYARAKKVVEHRLDDVWKERIVQGYSLWQR